MTLKNVLINSMCLIGYSRWWTAVIRDFAPLLSSWLYDDSPQQNKSRRSVDGMQLVICVKKQFIRRGETSVAHYVV